LSFLPGLQLQPIAIERIVVNVEDARVARALAAILAAGADRRLRPGIVVLR